MSDRSSEEIVEMAQAHIDERGVLVAEQRRIRDLPWRYAFWGVLGTLLLGLLAWPGTPLDQKMFAVGHGICAQINLVELGGRNLPICARNTGIYGSFLITSLYLLALGRSRAAKLPHWSITAMLGLFVIIMGIDGFNSLFVDLFLPHLYTPQNELRTLTGIGMGTSIAVLLFLILNMALRRDPDTDQPIVANWFEFGGALVLNLLILLALYGNITFMYWPIAIISWVGILGVLFCVNLLIAGVFMGYEAAVTHVVQLARPATLAIVLTVFELSMLAGFRYWLESQGLVAI
ncbi:MAG: DUF2085 domain-containing protein [Chloroflexi bacterium AL-W]|nr:DUF2085 domain-containing protein [Chloroflexi bacterium AL-N1]NOK65680.1 DUF2085 domain-containing protein [Chloroflexi bacterium AL-N10]NOK74379.1 DUF2085 domain-containing protein [Chloroflexi bacterium AL-N5]NOK80713.1 DUF2085 domain-containing protein [Chloroflexi bacterium AL-W]NOK88637.1 DUF2085 domain-containing protein [Chloroflexi bacterium AL-N15]